MIKNSCRNLLLTLVMPKMQQKRKIIIAFIHAQHILGNIHVYDGHKDCVKIIFIYIYQQSYNLVVY